MSSIKQRRNAVDKIYQDIKDYSLPRGISYPAYLQIVAQPLRPQALRKTFRNWRRMTLAVQKAHPDVWDHDSAAPEPVAPPPAPEPTPEPVKADPLEALRRASVTEEPEESNE